MSNRLMILGLTDWISFAPARTKSPVVAVGQTLAIVDYQQMSEIVN